jgi:hypothetical protein
VLKFSPKTHNHICIHHEHTACVHSSTSQSSGFRWIMCFCFLYGYGEERGERADEESKKSCIQ